MLNQGASQYEYTGALEAQHEPSQERAVPRDLNQQIRDTVEALRLKIENLRIYLSSRNNR